MRKVLALLLLLFSFSASGHRFVLEDGYHWYRVVRADKVSIRVNVVSQVKLQLLTAKHNRQALDRDCSSDFICRMNAKRTEKGLAILYRNKTTGAYNCQVYIVNRRDLATLRHEVKHCHGWEHKEP